MTTSSGKKTSSTASKSSTTRSKPKLKKVPSPAEAPPAPMLGKAQSTTKSAGPSDTPITGPEMKKQELIAKVVRQSGIKKKDAKPVVEAMLEVLGEAVADGRELNLKPFGKLMYNRTKETANARIIIAKIRQSKGNNSAGAPNPSVAAAAE